MRITDLSLKVMKGFSKCKCPGRQSKGSQTNNGEVCCCMPRVTLIGGPMKLVFHIGLRKRCAVTNCCLMMLKSEALMGSSFLRANSKLLSDMLFPPGGFVFVLGLVFLECWLQPSVSLSMSFNNIQASVLQTELTGTINILLIRQDGDTAFWMKLVLLEDTTKLECMLWFNTCSIQACTSGHLILCTLLITMVSLAMQLQMCLCLPSEITNYQDVAQSLLRFCI